VKCLVVNIEHQTFIAKERRSKLSLCTRITTSHHKPLTITKTNTNYQGGEILLFCSKNICNWRIKMDVFLINEKIENLSQNLKEIKESL